MAQAPWLPPQNLPDNWTPLQNNRLSNTERYQKELAELRTKKELEFERREHALAEREHRLQLAEKHKNLNKSTNSTFTIDGVTYSSYDEFMKTVHHKNWKAWRDAKNSWEQRKKDVDKEMAEIERRNNFEKLNDRESRHGVFKWHRNHITQNKKNVDRIIRQGVEPRELEREAYIPPSENPNQTLSEWYYDWLWRHGYQE